MMSIRDIFDYIESHPQWRFTVKLSCYEIYNEMIIDLLGENQQLVCHSAFNFLLSNYQLSHHVHRTSELSPKTPSKAQSSAVSLKLRSRHEMSSWNLFESLNEKSLRESLI
jgi:uncharacterized surface anchored protein